jgi:hypothetical protein
LSSSSKQPPRAWRVIADEMSHAPRGDRILELAEELVRALDEQSPSAPRKGMNSIVPDIADQSRNGTRQNPEQGKTGS